MWLYDPPCPTAQASKLACALHRGQARTFLPAKHIVLFQVLQTSAKRLFLLKNNAPCTKPIFRYQGFAHYSGFSFKLTLNLILQENYPFCLNEVSSSHSNLLCDQIFLFQFVFFLFFFYSSVKECSLCATWKDLFFFLSLHLCLKTYCLLYFCSDDFLLKLQM